MSSNAAHLLSQVYQDTGSLI